MKHIYLILAICCMLNTTLPAQKELTPFAEAGFFHPQDIQLNFNFGLSYQYVGQLVCSGAVQYFNINKSNEAIGVTLSPIGYQDSNMLLCANVSLLNRNRLAYSLTGSRRIFSNDYIDLGVMVNAGYFPGMGKPLATVGFRVLPTAYNRVRRVMGRLEYVGF